MTKGLRVHPLLGAFLYVASFSVIYHVLVYVSGGSGTVGVRQALIMSLLWLVPFLIWPRHPKQLGLILGFILLPASLLSFCYWLIYGQDFSQSAIFILFESNVAEGTEFIGSYWRWWYLLAIVAYLAIPYLLWRQLEPIRMRLNYRLALAAVLLLGVSWPFTQYYAIKHLPFKDAWLHQLKRMEPASPWQLLVGFQEYETVLANTNAVLEGNSTLTPLENFSSDPSRLPDRLVIVIGESTNRQRMSLYGYPRQTTPELDGIRDQLVVFDKVITPRPYTIEALQQALSFADQRNPDAFFDRPNLVNLLKQAGYHVSWITNQQTQTRRNTLLTALSQMADEQVYLNNNRDQNAKQFDDVVVQPFAKALATAASKQAVFVHLLGTHRQYHYRYPDAFARFEGREGVPEWVPDESVEEYNSYDNAILFNDHVVHQLIETLGSADKASLLLYFSDHGEEVFDTPKYGMTGRNEMSPTSAMYTVPFLVWASPQLRNVKEWQPFSHRPFISSDLIYTIADMIGINFKGLDYSRSLVSPTFLKHPRLIGDPEHPGTLRDYDQRDVITVSKPSQRASANI